MGLHTLTTSNHIGKIINVKIVKHSGDKEGEPEEAATQQKPSSGTANQSDETDTSEKEVQLEDLDLPKFDLGPTHVDQDKKINRVRDHTESRKKTQYRHQSRQLILTTPRLKLHAKVHSYKQIIRIRIHYKTTSLKNLSKRPKISQRKWTGQLWHGKPAITMVYISEKRHPQVWHSYVKP